MTTVQVDNVHFAFPMLLAAAVGVCIMLARAMLEFFLNVALCFCVEKFAKDYINRNIFIKLGMNFIEFRNIELSYHLLELLNKSCHDNCHFILFNMSSVKVQLIPYLKVEVDGIDVRMRALAPDEWSVEKLIAAMEVSRSEIFDTLTERLHRRRKKKALKAITTPVATFVLSLVDLILASSRVSTFNTHVGYCLNRTLETAPSSIVVSIGSLFVRPVGLSLEYFFSSGMTMQYEIENVSIFCQPGGGNDIHDADELPLLEPASITGKIRLPKILSQMMRSDPLESKYGHLFVEASSLVVNGTLKNLIALSDFSIMIDIYRKWYASVEQTFIAKRETNQDIMFTYITAYLKYTSESDVHKKSELRKLYHNLEKRLCDDDIRLSRSLVLGWYATDVLLLKKFREDAHFRLFETFRSNDQKMVQYRNLLKVKYQNEALSCKELRKMKVDIKTKSIFINLPCFDTHGRGKARLAAVRRTTVWLQGTKMHITEPIVRMSELYDEPRILRGTVKRLTLANTNYGHSEISPINIDKVTKNIPIFDIIDVRQADKSFPSLMEEEPATEVNMVSFNVIEDIWEHKVTVSAELSNTVIVPNVSHLLDLAEYAILAIEDIIHVYMYYVTACQLPSTTMALPVLPASLMKGDVLHVEVKASNICVCFTEKESNLDHIPQCLVLSLDAIAKISSSPVSESIEATIPMLKLLTCEKMPSRPVDPTKESDEDISIFAVQICPSATHIQYSNLSVAYRLDKRKDFLRTIICPDVPEADISRLHASSGASDKKLKNNSKLVEDKSHRVDYWRWEETSSALNNGVMSSASATRMDGEKVMMLTRDIQCLASPIVLCISESECQILAQWCKYSVDAVFPQLFSAEVGRDRLASDRITDIRRSRFFREVMRKNRASRDEELYLEVKFRMFDMTGDGFLEPFELKAIISKILAPLNLLQHELDQKILDIFYILDYNLDGKVSLSEFRRNLISVERNFSSKGYLILRAGEILGSQIPDYITKGAHLDSTASRKLWDLIEREIGIMYSARNLGGKTSHVVQNMLIRLCGDFKLARSVWENVIRPNIRSSESTPYAYPWIITDEEGIGGDVDFRALAEQFLSKPMANLANVNVGKVPSELIVCSYTKIRIEMSSVVINLVDNFLGPTVPRFQLKLNELSISGEVLNEGIRPHWSAVSKDGVGVVGKLGLQSSFFNSLVQEHEPIIEPWELSCVVRKQETNGFLDCLIKGDYLKVNLSTACLQTMASTLMNVFGVRSSADGHLLSAERRAHFPLPDELFDEAQISRISEASSVQTMRDHYCLVKNLSGCPLGFTVSAPHVLNSGTEIFVKQESAKFITIPLLNASLRQSSGIKGSAFAHLFVNTYLDDDSISFVQHRPVPLHVLALNSIAIYPNKTSSNSDNSVSQHEKTYPALILDMETGNTRSDKAMNIYNNSTLTVRSNVKIRNFTDRVMWVRLLIEDLTEQNSSRLDTVIGINDVFFLPLRYVSYLNSLQLSLKPATESADIVKWSNSVNVKSLLSHLGKLQGNNDDSPFLYSAHSFHMLNAMAVSRFNCPLFDHTIDIISGIRVINALPYKIALKSKVWNSIDFSETGQTLNFNSGGSHYVYLIQAGDSFWLPLTSRKRINVRLKINSKKIAGNRKSPSNWSNSIDFIVGDEDSEIALSLPHSDNENSIHCNVLLTNDLSALDNSSDIHTAPALYIYSDIWVQNNSSIPLRYKFGRSALERSIITCEDYRINLEEHHTIEENIGFVNLDPTGRKILDQSSILGPVLSPSGTKSLYVQEWKDGNYSNFSPSLIEFKNLVHVQAQSSNHPYWSDSLTLVNGHTDEIRTGCIWLGYLVRQGSGIYQRTKIVTITPRYVIQNKTSIPIRIFSTLVSRMKFTSKAKICETHQIWEAAEAARKRHTSSDIDPPEPIDELRAENWTVQEELLPADVENDDAVLFAEAVLQKRRKRKSSILRSVGATKGLSPNYLKEALSKDEDSAALIVESANLPMHTLSHAGDFASLEPSHSAVMYSFGEESSMPKLFTQSICVSLGNVNGAKSKNFMLVKIISAENLQIANSNGYSDPYCSIYWQGELLYRTREQKNNLNPLWRESFLLPLPKDDLSSLELRIEVMDHNVSRQNTFLGQVTLRSSELLYSVGEELRHDLRNAPSKDDSKFQVRGSIVLSVIPVSREDIHPWTPPLHLDVPGFKYLNSRMTNGFSKLLTVSVISSGPVMIATINEQSEEYLPAFRIENRTPDLRVRFRQSQTDEIDYVRRTLRPAEGCYYGWDDPNLPHSLELAVVDCNDTESQVTSYKIDTLDDSLPPINTRGMSTKSQNLRVRLHIQGHIRVLTINAATTEELEEDMDDSLGILSGCILHASIDVCFCGISIAAIDDVPDELFNFVVEGIRITSLAENPLWSVSVMHVQLDNMMEKSKYPVMICPVDSGLNSERNPYFFHFDGGSIPVLELQFEPDWYAPNISDTWIIRTFELRVRPLNVIVDLNFVVQLVKAMITRRISGTFMLLCDLLVTRRITSDSLENYLIDATPCPKSNRAKTTLFVKSMILHSMAFHMLLSIKIDTIKMDQNRDLAALTDNSRTIRYLVELSRSITAINPKFEFFGVKLENSFDRLDAILWRIAFVYISQAILQSYKIFGSMDAIGDPVGVIKDLSSSLKSFLIHSGLELSGKTPFRAEGLKHLAQGIIGSPIGSLGKVTRGVGQVLGNVSHLEVDLGQESAPAHIGEGILQAGKVLTDSIHHGVVNVIMHPYKGIKEGSIVHTVRGTAQGLLGLLLSPAIGTFGAITKLTQSIDSTTHVFDRRLKGRMRPNRPLYHNPVVMSLDRTIIYKSFSFKIESIYIPLLDALPNYFACVTVQYGGKYFSTTILPCRSKLSWHSTDASFHFPAKPFGDTFRTKMLVVKLKVLETLDMHPGSGITIARKEFHPLDMSEHLEQLDEAIADFDYDGMSLATVDERMSIAKSNMGSLLQSPPARGPEKISKLRYNISALTKRVSSGKKKQHKPSLETEKSDRDISFAKWESQNYSSAISASQTSTAIGSIVSNQELFGQVIPRESPLSEVITPGSGKTHKSLESFSLKEDKFYKMTLTINREQFDELMLGSVGMSHFRDVENDSDVQDICVLNISGEYISAISNSVKFSDTMLSRQDPDVSDVFKSPEEGSMGLYQGT